ncbi:phosphatidate cytidylyltransferase, partial [Chloroflexota bacterium]
MLKKRVITALWGIPILATAIWFGKPLPWFTILVAIWGVLAAFEFYRLVTVAKVAPLTFFGLIWVLLFILNPHFDYAAITPLILTSLVTLSLIWLLLRSQK